MPGYNSITGDESIMYADNCSFDGTERDGKLSADKQIFLGSGTAGTNIKRGTIVSGAGITITQTDTSLTEANLTFALTSGATGVDSFAMQTGTSPIVPDGTGLVTFNGSSVAAGTNPVRTNGTAANTMQLEVQTSVALAAEDATRIGLSNFDSGDFTVSAGGFVSLSGSAVASTYTADTGSATPAAGNINILGGPGVTTSASGSTVTVNSVVFTDTAATTMAVDNGYFATAAGTYNLPATAAQGELIHIVCDTSGAVVVDAPALNFVRIGTLITSSGGTVTSTQQGDSLTLRYRLSTLTWHATSVIGTWLVA